VRLQRWKAWAGSLRASRFETQSRLQQSQMHNTEAMDKMPSLTEPNAATRWLRR